MLMRCFVCVAEVSEEFAGRMPGAELHRLKEQSLISFWGVRKIGVLAICIVLC
jgi:hypothetical protein